MPSARSCCCTLPVARVTRQRILRHAGRALETVVLLWLYSAARTGKRLGARRWRVGHRTPVTPTALGDDFDVQRRFNIAARWVSSLVRRGASLCGKEIRRSRRHRLDVRGCVVAPLVCLERTQPAGSRSAPRGSFQRGRHVSRAAPGMLGVERAVVVGLRQQGHISATVLRAIERSLDLEEARLLEL